jgi:poly-gamma-glutamate capsule biosynthesis protein CapA/YwtB (metallophosphatase superfamily)
VIWEEVEAIARHGDPYSIGLLCNRLLRKQGITVQVSREDDALILVLTAKQLPKQRKYVKLLRQELKRYQIATIALAKISGRQTGAHDLGWTETISFKKAVGKRQQTKQSQLNQAAAQTKPRSPQVKPTTSTPAPTKAKPPDRSSSPASPAHHQTNLSDRQEELFLEDWVEIQDNGSKELTTESVEIDAEINEIEHKDAIAPGITPPTLDAESDLDNFLAPELVQDPVADPVETASDTFSAEVLETRTEAKSTTPEKLVEPATDRSPEPTISSTSTTSPVLPVATEVLPKTFLPKFTGGAAMALASLASFGLGISAERVWQVSDRFVPGSTVVQAESVNQANQSELEILNRLNRNDNTFENRLEEEFLQRELAIAAESSNNQNQSTPSPIANESNEIRESSQQTGQSGQTEQAIANDSENPTNNLNNSAPAKTTASTGSEASTSEQKNLPINPTATNNPNPNNQFNWRSARVLIQANFLGNRKAETITLKAVGDMIPGTNYPSYKLPENQQILFQAIAGYLTGSDVLFGNFESTLTTHPYAAKDINQANVFAFRTPPEYAKQLKQVGFDVLSVANNHSFDFGDVGFLDTIAHIEAAGMVAVGKKDQIRYLDVRGNRVAFIGFSYLSDHNSILDLEAAKALIQTAAANAEIVVVSVHAGAEGTDAMDVGDRDEYFFSENRGNILRFARTMIDAGADLILGHGPHVPRAIELYSDRLIAYSLGNFMGYQTLSSVAELGYSLILELELDQEGRFINGKIIPVHIDANGIPKPDTQNRSINLIKQLTERNFPDTDLNITPTGALIDQSAEAIANN